jgi:protein-L-isoaspartate(D-aspartate) O-methyltransferase
MPTSRRESLVFGFVAPVSKRSDTVHDEGSACDSGGGVSMDRSEAFRRFYARLITKAADVTDSRVVEAFASVPRESFMGPGPWLIRVSEDYISTETDDPAVLYQDILVGLVPEKGINNGEPSLHARCIGAAAPQPGETVIHVGCGTGYYTAVLSQLVADSGSIHAFEIDPELARKATENLVKYPNVTVVPRTGLENTLPVVNVIYVSAGLTHVPALWLDALALGGRLVLPLTPSGRLGCMLMVTRVGETSYGARVLSPVGFIPCVGGRDERQSRALAEALETRAVGEIRSLRRGGNPDDTAWCIGDGWWLSTAVA